MLTELIVIVSVAAGDAHDPTTEAMLRAAHEVLGNEASIDVRERDAPPLDSEIAAESGNARAVVLADVRWLDAARTHAHLRLRARGAARWLERDVGFDAIDAPAERGRTLGFALASMLPSPGQPAHAQPPPHAPPRSGPTIDASRGAPAPSARGGDDAHPSVGAFYAAGAVTTGVSGSASSVGATLAAEWQAFRPVAFRFTGSFRAGEVAAAQASSLFANVGLGATLTFVRATPDHPVGLGAHADVLLQLQSLAHLSEDDPSPVRRARFLPGADLFGELNYAVAGSAVLVAGFGVETAFGTTAVYTHHVRVVDVAPVRLAAELGVRARF